MIPNSANLAPLRVAFSAAFQGGFNGVQSMRDRVATVIPSSTREQKYGWLGEIPGMREWIGPRAVQNLAEHDYAIVNKDFELTVGVRRTDIEDDNLGTYATRFAAMGEAAARHPELLVWNALKAGDSTLCYDGQNFFDTDHPVLDEAGNVTTVSNWGGGSGAGWYLLNTTGVLKPLIFQSRKPPTFVSKDRETDETVFNNNQFLYGVDYRCNVGYGFWQMAYGSKQTLNATAYSTARAAMMGFKGDYGKPLGIVPNLLVVPPSLESAARKILNSEYAAGGETNEWKGTAELLVVPWLA